ncbi:MAG: hypothetical protein H0X03_04575 [Nitrosopumilus sp.]|nr:hypothetical protein [Nitrosopumilus sp.]
MKDLNNNKDVDKTSRNNIFQIMDGIIAQLNKTKKMFIIMILTIMIIPPIAFVVTFELLGPPFPFHDGEPPQDNSGSNFNPAFGITRAVPILISIIWLGIGIWQWFELSKWTKKYERYKELQKKIGEKLDEDNTDNDSKEERQ